MKKLGFTMSELIIAVGIVGVITAITLPAITNITPDKNKLKVIEYYNKINEINQALLSNEALFHPKYNTDGELIYYGFANMDAPLEWNVLKNDIGYNGSAPVGPFKYPYFFNFALAKEAKSKVELDDGANLIIKNSNFDYNAIPRIANYTITIDLDGDKGKNCIFGETGCKTPDTFIFNVDREGNVSAGDALTEAYLLNPTEMHNKQDDFKKAKELLPNYQ